MALPVASLLPGMGHSGVPDVSGLHVLSLGFHCPPRLGALHLAQEPLRQGPLAFLPRLLGYRFSQLMSS